ncbi:MAG: FAD:protein FMN transferase [Lachnospiraceae bacterium]
MKKIYRAAALLLLVAFLTGLVIWQGKDRKNQRCSIQFLDVFDTVTEFTAYGESEKQFKKQAELLHEKLQWYHKLYDIYHEYEGMNNLKTINDQAGRAPVKVDEEVIQLLKFSKKMYKVTNQKTNIALGGVLKEWHISREEALKHPELAAVPQKERLLEASVHADLESVVIDEEESTVFLKEKGLLLDVGSIGKGYAVQRLAEYAETIGMQHLLINVGGNIYAVGDKADNQKWKVGIQNPDSKSEVPYLKTVQIEDQCVVTSGDYQRFFIVNGKRYCHIIDPETLFPPEYCASVSIIAKDSGEADALSTALFTMPYKEGSAYVRQEQGVEAMWIFKDGTIKYSDGFEKYLVP